MEAQFYLRYSPTDTGSNIQLWAAEGGYTTDVGKAAAYSLEQAQRMHDGRCGDDIPLAKHLVDDTLIRAVDHQYLPTEFEADDYTEFVIQVRHLSLYNGNDIYFVSKQSNGSRYSHRGHHGQQSCNYNDAKTFSLDEAKEFTNQWQAIADKHNENPEWPLEYIIYPKALIDELARSTFQRFNIDTKTMIKDAGIKIYKAPKITKEKFKCDSCGRYVSEATYYSRVYNGEPCKNCEYE